MPEPIPPEYQGGRCAWRKTGKAAIIYDRAWPRRRTVSDISVNTKIRGSIPKDQYGRIPAIMAVFGDLIREFGREI